MGKTEDRAEKKAQTATPKSKLIYFKWLSAIAASFILMYVMVYFISESQTKELILVHASNDNQKLELSDGSTLTLKRDANIRYLPFNDHIRELHLSGEAYFRIAKEDRPFVVRTLQGDVHVIGTSFFLNSGLRLPDLAIKVLEGQVHIYPAGNYPELELNMGEYVNSLDPVKALAKINDIDTWSWYRSDPLLMQSN